MAPDNEAVQPAADDITEQVIIALRRIIRAIDLRSRFLVTHYGLTGPQLIVLRQLSKQGGLPVGRLARAVHLSQATVTGILTRMEKRGLIQRRRGEQDRRRVQASLTAAGEELLSTAPPLLQEDFTEEFSKLADWEQAQILSSLQRMVAMMEAKHIEAGPVLATGPIGATTEETEAFLTPSAGASGSQVSPADSKARLAEQLDTDERQPGPIR